MGTYKINYTYLDYSNNIHGERKNGYDEYEADTAQDAVDQCREDFYICHNMRITSISKWSYAGYWNPVFDTAWK